MGIDEQLPTIAIVTHYDAFGIAPVSCDGYLIVIAGWRMVNLSLYDDETVIFLCEPKTL